MCVSVFFALLNFPACPRLFVRSARLTGTSKPLLKENPVTLDEQIDVRECPSAVWAPSTELALKKFCLVWEVILLLSGKSVCRSTHNLLGMVLNQFSTVKSDFARWLDCPKNSMNQILIIWWSNLQGAALKCCTPAAFGVHESGLLVSGCVYW